MIKILFVGDVVGDPGRQVLKKCVPLLREKHELDLVIANSENAAGGLGITPSVVKELYAAQVDVLTSGNHAWDKKEGVALYDEYETLLRPANYPRTSYFHTPGKGHVVVTGKNGIRVAVLNLIGRVFMDSYDCPFQVADQLLPKLQSQTPVILVDMHAETTSEKKAMAYFLNGRVSCVIGTHTHVQTADEQILDKGTAFLTDAGMTGPHNSVIGMDREKVLMKFLTRRPVKYEVGKGDVRLQGAVVTIDETTGKAHDIQRVNEAL